jgi:glycerol-3-phosphate acyltransferase PlsX
MNLITIALDAMGGDHAPHIVIDGASISLKKNPSLRFLTFGDEQKVLPLLNKHPHLLKNTDFIHCNDFIAGDEKPLQALRTGRHSSMAKAIKAVERKDAHAVVSAGNTGAYMAFSKIILGSIPGIQRPAIPAVLPTTAGYVVVLDLGANLECNSENLIQFALMGSVLCEKILGITSPRVGLLNIGSEDIKGHDFLQETHHHLKSMNNSIINYHGFVEGDDVMHDGVDVVVTDGFTGNVFLKGTEGAAKFFVDLLKKNLSSSFLGRLGYLIAHKAFSNTRQRIDPRLYNGAVFLGLNHVAVKSHGGTDALGFSNAINVAQKAVNDGICGHIDEKMSFLKEKINLTLSQKKCS